MGLRGVRTMRAIAIIAAVLAISAGPAFAQTAPDAARLAQLERAERYLSLTQGAGMTKLVRDQLEEFYQEDALPEDQRRWLTDNMTEVYEEVMQEVVAELRDHVADQFTAPELDALITFYGTPMGRSIVNKEAELSLALQQAMMPHLMTRMGSLGEKFCLRFDCSAMGDAAAKQGR